MKLQKSLMLTVATLIIGSGVSEASNKTYLHHMYNLNPNKKEEERKQQELKKQQEELKLKEEMLKKQKEELRLKEEMLKKEQENLKLKEEENEEKMKVGEVEEENEEKMKVGEVEEENEENPMIKNVKPKKPLIKMIGNENPNKQEMNNESLTKKFGTLEEKFEESQKKYEDSLKNNNDRDAYKLAVKTFVSGVMGIDIDTTNANEAKKVYKKLSQRLHPDRGGTEYLFKILGKANDLVKAYHTNTLFE